MNLSLSHRPEQFARLLDGEARSDDPDLAPLVALAEALQAVPAAPSAAPRAEFRDALRRRLVAVAAVQTASEPAPTPADRVRGWAGSWRVQRRFAVAVAGAAALVVVGGIGIGASRSLPDDPLYGVKRAAERVQLATASGDYAKGQRHLQFARERMVEVDALVGRTAALIGATAGHPAAAGVVASRATTDAIISALEDMNSETVAGTNDLTRAYAHGQRKAQSVLADFAHDQRSDLVAVLPALPPEARAVAATSLALLTEVDHQASVLAAATCSSGSCMSTVPSTAVPGTSPLPGTGSGNPGLSGAPAKPGVGVTPPSAGSTPAPGQSAGGTQPGLPGVGITTGSPSQPLPGVTVSPTPLVTLSPVPLPTVTLPSVGSTVTSLTTLLSPSPTPTSTSLLPLPLPSLGG